MSDVRADVASERALLGLLLADGGFTECRNSLEAADFWQPRHEAIWKAMHRVVDAGNTVGLATVQVALEQSQDRADPIYLTELIHDAPVGAMADFYLERIRTEARFRDLDGAARKVMQASQNRSIEYGVAREVALKAIDEATRSAGGNKHARVRDVLPQVIEIAEGKVPPALSTPWPDLDRLITGLAPGRFVVVGARPGVGKSLMGTNLALHFAEKHGHAVLIASLEMGEVEVVQRLVSARARINLTALSSGKMTEEQWAKMNTHYAAIEALPIVIDDSANQSIGSIRDLAREVAREREDLSLIVVDYLQLMAGATSSKRVEALGEISRGLKVLARETGSCVVAMAQLNRESARDGAKPKMSDLRESGSIEADADQVILLHRADDQVPELEVIVDKNRWGLRGHATLHVAGHYASLMNTEWSPSKGVA
jgi:replicative DNA helicase